MPIPPDQLNRHDFAVNYHGRGYGTRNRLKNIRARGRIIFLFFSRAACMRALKIWQINSAILKVPDAAWIR